MNIFATLSLHYKILAISLIAALGFSSYLAYTWKVTQANDQRLALIQQVNFPIIDRLGQSWLSLFSARTSMQEAISEGDEDLLKTAQQHQKKLIALLNDIATMAPQYASEMNRLKQQFNTYMSSAQALTIGMIDGSIALSEMGPRAATMHKQYDDFTQQLTAFRDVATKDFAERLDNAKQESHTALNTGVVIGIFMIVVIFIVGATISRVITGNLKRIITELDGMATGKGDLTIRLETKAKDEVGLLVQKFNAFVTHLQLMIKVLANLSLGVTDKTSEMEKNAQHTQSGIMSQQQEIHMVATAITQMAQTANEVSNSAGEASTATERANEHSQKGQEAVNNNITSIGQLAEEISEARDVISGLSEEVQKIASASQDINAIAEQTNLLALNAAIEAARAGEQGRGFAVVADEVRTLAARTGTSTRDIQSIIESLLKRASQAVDVMERNQERASDSVNRAQATAHTLQEILDSVATISEMNLMVASSAEEQSSVAEEVSKNIERINEFSEQTVADAKSTAAFTNSLADQAHQLKAIVNEFKV
ncbi:methyl-accepting chemotaxis protein [Bermanella sp. R86510]|uniref:methyl-accepting chemotaxis protein n=1 Tax=unclassified Bermanella TaxID=2627862 RepID=UPI0037CB8CFB